MDVYLMGSGVDLCHQIAGQSIKSELGALSTCHAPFFPPSFGRVTAK